MTVVGETDGVGWARRAVTLLLQRDLPTYPRLRGPEAAPDHRWRMSIDVAADMGSLHPHPPLVDLELFGYPVVIDGAAPAGTLGLEGLE